MRLSATLDIVIGTGWLLSSADYEGTGVGLAIVKRIMERNGGEISGEGAPDKGATIRIVLPAA